MAEYIIMPKLGFNMDKGILLAWFKKEGDYINEQEIIFEIETDKTVMEVEAQISGFLRKILVVQGQEVPVNLPIAIIGDKDEDISKMIDEASQRLKKAEIIIEEEYKIDKNIPQGVEENQKIEQKKEKEEFIKISPRARRKAKELGIKVQSLKGSGPEGLVIEKDIISYYQKYKIKVSTVDKELVEEAGIEEVEKIEKEIPYTGIRKIIGDRLSMSKFSAPHIYLTTSIDMSKTKELLYKMNQEIDKKISINDLIIFVVAKVLSEQPEINCSLINEKIIYHKDINIGVAVALKEGLIVPVVRNANSKTLFTLSREIKNLIKLAQDKKLMPNDYKGGTFTVSNLGMYGIEQFTSIINPPEAAILSVGKINRVPSVIKEEEENIEIRSLMKITLSVDHRLIDGLVAARFLNQVKYYLEFPETLIF
jgi:pyruvate dehydrogenase E2 component (dihydrolipoamide acetyltransferase)